MIINSTGGFIGIGTATPTERLHVNSAAGANSFRAQVNGATKLLVHSNGGVAVGSPSAPPTNGLYVSGNVGIGTTSPTSKLQLNVPSSVSPLKVQVNGVTKLYIDQAGKVGIGTTTPTYKLHVNTNDTTPAFFGTGPSPCFALSRDNNPNLIYGTEPALRLGLATFEKAYTNYSVTGDVILQNLNKGALIFSTGARYAYYNTMDDEKMRITGDGKVGIGTVDPTAMLHSVGSVRFEAIPEGFGVPLVVDEDGNVFRSPYSAKAAKKNSDVNEEVKSLKEQVLQLQNALQVVQSQLSSLTASFSSANSTGVPVGTEMKSGKLEQNVPNPATNTTVINYSIPENGSNAEILITDIQGRLVKTFKVGTGKGQINIESGNLAPGVYNYTLNINRMKVDTKQMVISK